MVSLLEIIEPAFLVRLVHLSFLLIILSLGCDLNRQFVDADPQIFPNVNAIKQLMTRKTTYN